MVLFFQCAHSLLFVMFQYSRLDSSNDEDDTILITPENAPVTGFNSEEAAFRNVSGDRIKENDGDGDDDGDDDDCVFVSQRQTKPKV